MDTKQLTEEAGKLIGNLQNQINALISTYSPDQQKEFNLWYSKCQSILKLPLEEQPEALKKLQDEFKHYKPKV